MGAEINGLDHDTRRQLGAWLARANDTVYQASTDGIVHAFGSGKSVTKQCIKTDGVNPPATVRQEQADDDGNTSGALACHVRKNDYWKTENSSAVYWIREEVEIIRP